jgi:hypothetical protein
MRSFITCSFCLLIIMEKSRRKRRARQAARMGRRKMHIGYLWESQKVRDHWEAHNEVA